MLFLMMVWYGLRSKVSIPMLAPLAGWEFVVAPINVLLAIIMLCEPQSVIRPLAHVLAAEAFTITLLKTFPFENIGPAPGGYWSTFPTDRYKNALHPAP